MTDDAVAHAESPRSGTGPIVATLLALAVLTTCELIVVRFYPRPAPRVVLLFALLVTKVGLVLRRFMRANDNRSAAWFVLVAIGFAAGVAVVLLLETAYRVRVR